VSKSANNFPNNTYTYHAGMNNFASMRFIDLFAGAGGLSEGFIKAGFTPVAHVEMDRAACYTLRTRMAYHQLKAEGNEDIYHKYLKGDIGREALFARVSQHIHRSVINTKIDDETIPQIFRTVDELADGQTIDAIVGGPPCQAYSLVGRARDKNGMRGDERNYLYKYYGRFLKRYSPKVFVFENVLGLLTAEKGLYLRNMKAYFKRIGYELDHTILNARDFGVLQNRKRILIIGWRKDLTDISMPVFTPTEWKYQVSDVLRDMPALRSGQGKMTAVNYGGPPTEYLKRSAIRNGVDVVTQHTARPHSDQDKTIYRMAVETWDRSKQRLRYTDLPEKLRTHKNNSTFLDRFKVVAANEPYSHTVVAHISKDGHHYIHPDIRQNRSLSVREAARLQSFPDDFYFEGIKETNPRTAAFKQIGNAVPPMMAEQIALGLKAML